ncbi:MAG TPA: recombinase family protein [Candidatus Obscuribacter sp.]|nr:recombinase family protein [Candidatus Obscuribacter sp.]
MSKLILYGRVSTEDQVKNTSLEDQRYKLEGFAAAKGDEIVEEYLEEGWSGTTLWRPRLWEAISRLKCLLCKPRPMPSGVDQAEGWWKTKCTCGKMEGADGLIVWDMKRLSRNSKNLIFLVDEVLSKFNKGLIVVSGPGECDTRTPQGRFIIQLFGLLAQLDREEFLGRMRDSKKAQRREGKFLGSRPPYGFIARYEGNGLGINPREELVVLTVMTEYYAGRRWDEIVNKLENEKIYTRGGQVFKYQALQRMFHGPEGSMHVPEVQDAYRRWHQTAIMQAEAILKEERVLDAERVIARRKERLMPNFLVDTTDGAA